MDFKLIWSERSIEDLGGIVRFIAPRDGSQVARQIGFGIYGRAQVLTRHPEAGSVLAEKGDRLHGQINHLRRFAKTASFNRGVNEPEQTPDPADLLRSQREVQPDGQTGEKAQTWRD